MKKRNKSKLVENLDVCFLCGQKANAIHEVFFGQANRNKSIEDGMYLGLCNKCHNMGNKSAHLCRETDLMLKRFAQKMWENQHKCENPRQAFIERYGKSWL